MNYTCSGMISAFGLSAKVTHLYVDGMMMSMYMRTQRLMGLNGYARVEVMYGSHKCQGKSALYDHYVPSSSSNFVSQKLGILPRLSSEF